MPKSALLFLFLFLTLTPILVLFPGCGKAAGPPLVSEVILRVNPPSPAVKGLREMARGLLDLFLPAGCSLTPEALEQALRALKETKRFADIRVERERTGEATSLLFTMTALPEIREIRIDGNYPLFENDILGVMTLAVGDSLREEDLSREAERIVALYRNEGFSEAGVRIEVLPREKTPAVALRVAVTKGRYDILKAVSFRGARAFDGERLRWRMKTWRMRFLPGMAGRFLPAELTRDLETLTAFYRREGYADARLGSTVSRSGRPGEVTVEIAVEEGERYEVAFEGNATLSGQALGKEVVLFREGNAHDLGILRSVANLRDRYRNEGFLQAGVSTETDRVEGEGGPVRRVSFRIVEGPRSVVESVNITGNESFPGGEVRDEMLTRPPGLLGSGAFVPEVLKDDLLAIRTLYVREGFRSADVRDEVVWKDGRRKAAVTVAIREGPRTVVKDVAVEGFADISEEEFREALSLKRGMPFRESMVRDDENALGRIVSRKGYPHVRVKGETEFADDGRAARIVYRVETGPFVRLKNLFFSGNFRTRESLLLRTADLEPGSAFTLERVLESQRNLRNTGIFDVVQIRSFGLAEQKEEVDLLVDVTEKKPYTLETSLGYQSDKGFYGKLGAGDRNLFGLNKKLRLSGELSETNSRGELGITEPRLFGSSVSATAVLFGERKTEYNQEFGTKSFGVSLGFTYPWSARWTAGLGSRLERKSRFFTGDVPVSDPSLDGDPEDARDILTVTPSLNYDSRDSFLRPRKGIFSSIATDVSKGINNSLDNFLKYRFDFRYYVTPWERITFALMGRAGYLEAFGSATGVPDDQLFYSGGAFTVRGYEENRLYYDTAGTALGGRASILGSAEVRMDLGKNFEFDLFVDSGHLGELKEETDLPSIRSSVGLGLRYITPVGPIGILYGFKLNAREGESPGRLHFAVGYTF